MMGKTVSILGIEIHNVARSDIATKILYFHKEGKKVNVFPVNVDMLVKATKDPFFKEILKASFLIPDGKPLIWASKFYGNPLIEKTAGSDIFFDICKMSSEKNVKLFFLGAGYGVGDIAAHSLRRKYRNIQIVGTYSPPFGFENKKAENEKIINLVNRANPDILFLAFGAPKQEKWIVTHKDKLNVPISIAIGASLDFVAGLKKIPPQWIKKAGFAWLYRLIDEPNRLWRRYLIEDIIFFKYIVEEKFGKKF